MLTKQKIFNEVKTHLLSQNAKSYTDYMYPNKISCAFRGNHNRKCAIGHLIKDEFYYPELESCTLISDEVIKVLNLSNVDAVLHMDLLKELQAIHDNDPPHTWPFYLNQLEKTL